MYKKSLLFVVATFLAITISTVNSAFTQNDFLKVDGASIKNNYGKGAIVYLRGTNIGNLFVQESWMSATNSRDQKTTLENLTRRFGQDKALELLEYYESNYLKESDFDNLKNLGASLLRVPFTYMNFYRKNGDSWYLRHDAFNRLDWIVSECSKRGIYVILDLHGAFGSQNGQDHSGEVIDRAEDVTFFRNEDLMSKTLELWRVIASHYKGNPAVAGYDTLNEPGEKAGQTSERHWNFYDRMYKTIRGADPDHIIIFEACWGTANLPNPSRYGWTNVMYQYHHYTWDYTDDSDKSYNGQKQLIDNLVNSVNSANYGVPTYIGEFNCFDNTRGWDYVLNKMNMNGWHYSTWSYKARGQGSWGVYHEYGHDNKVDPANSSESDIRNKWGSGSIGTNNNDHGITYNALKNHLPGTIAFADKPMTKQDFMGIKANINGKYVCADNYGQTNLVAIKDAHQEWEDFRLIENSDGTVSFLSRANNKYLCTIFDDADTEHPVRARSNQISTWEKFYRIKNDDGSYSFKTFEKNLYLQADIDSSTYAIIHARGQSIGTWERFSLENNKVSEEYTQ